jgi:pyrroloquinoline quinone biosynthesis protein B
MSAFIRENAPWSQLVELNNIKLLPLNNKKTVQVIDGIKITPVVVPHRDEFSETVGYKIQGPNKTVLFIPDIDKWDLWNEDLVELLNSVDLAFLDATFFDREEVNFRPFSEIPHPFVKETMKLLELEAIEIKNKVYFIHMNHTNPLLNPKSKESLWVETQGFHIARFGQEFDL